MMEVDIRDCHLSGIDNSLGISEFYYSNTEFRMRNMFICPNDMIPDEVRELLLNRYLRRLREEGNA